MIDTEQLCFPQDLLLQKGLEVCLHRHYPGHFWQVDCNIRQGMINIRNLFLSGKYGFRLKLKGIFSASQIENDVIMAGGELLERYNLSRGKFNLDKWSAIPTNFAGNLFCHKD